MIRSIALIAFFLAVVAVSEVIEKNLEKSEAFAIAVADGQSLPADLVLEGQSSDVVVRAKRYYGCGCGCGCATVAAVSAAPCYGCCGCGYGK